MALAGSVLASFVRVVFSKGGTPSNLALLNNRPVSFPFFVKLRHWTWLGVQSVLLLIASQAFAATSTPFQYTFGSFFEFVATGAIGPLCSNAIQYEKSTGPICGSLPNGSDRNCIVTGDTEKTPNGWVCHIYYDGELITNYEYFGLCADPDIQDYVDSLDACVSDNPIPATPTGDNNKNLGCPEGNKTIGNPCNPATGNKIHTEVDAELANGNLRFIRTYNSQQDVDYGLGWVGVGVGRV